MRFDQILMAAAQGGGVALDTDAVSWRDQVVTNGGTVSANRLALVSGTIRALKAGGSWALDDDIWMLVAENATQALTSIKQRRLATVTAAPTFAADDSYTFNGTSNYIDTGFIPQTHKVAMAQDNVRLGAYLRTNVTSSGYIAGAVSSASRTIRIRPRTGTTLCTGEFNNGGGTFTLPAADTRGFWAGSRSTADATTYLAYKTGAVMVRASDPSSFSTTGLPIVSLLIGAQNNAGTPATFAAQSVGLVVIGAALSAAQELAEYNAIQAHMTALGANV
jgi:hypothetical protein